jgi:hypothetical protein
VKKKDLQLISELIGIERRELLKTRQSGNAQPDSKRRKEITEHILRRTSRTGMENSE